MYLKDLITRLQQIYDMHSQQKDLLGEPEIVIDKFERVESKTFNRLYEHRGITPDIAVTRTTDGVFLVLSSVKDRKILKKPIRKISK
jgi:hypothetical protein